MNTKKCSKCKKIKSVSEFAWKHVGKDYQTACKICKRKENKAHYYKNKQYYIDKAKRRKDRNRLWLKEYKKTLFCEKCGESHPACLVFHHNDSSRKIREISIMVLRSFAMDKIIAEIEKCDVLCSNCHRKLHWQRSRSESW